MNPNFALDFRNDQITLLHSQEGVWVQIGIVAVDDPDLEAALGYMRSTALGLSPRGIASKLILPDAAILYTTLEDLSPDPKMRQKQISVALIGRTPYEVADLVYDWTDEGAKAHLAVIARETLDEAEAFATQHRFNPVAFAAWPQEGPFQGEADFGRSATATDMISPIEAPQTADYTEVLSARDFEMGDAAQEMSEVPQIDITVDSVAADDLEFAQQMDALAEQIAEQDVPPAVTALDLTDPAEVMADDAAASDRAARLDAASFQETIDHDDTDVETADMTQPAEVLSDEEQPQAAKPNPAPPVQPDLFAPSFAAVVDEEADEAPMALDVPMDESVADDPAPISGPSAGKAQTLLAEFAARRETALGLTDSAGRVEPVLSAGKTAAPAFTPLSAKPEIRAEPAPRIAAVAAQKSGRATEASLGSKPAIKRPAPKGSASRSALMGFVLTILLLIALFAAATLSSFLTSAWNSYTTSTAVASDQPSVSDEVAVDLPSDDIMTPSSPAPQTADLAVPTALPDPISSPAPSLASDNSVSERLGTLVPLATPAALPQPIVIAPPNITTASAETAAAAPLITPTAQGVLTPEGVFLIAGRPNVVPSARPKTVVAAALQRPEIAEVNPSVSTAFADPALAGKKPLLRPEGLAPKIAPIQSDPALAGKRPMIRSGAAADAAQIARASLAQPDAARSAMAVTISRLPVARPKRLKAPVEAPQELAVATPEIIVPDTPEVRTPEAPAANAPLEADNEPEVVAPRSSSPRTVVSKNATYKNAINLSKLNLIGVYGSQSNRYALIRQSNGRFKKVYVGDRFDGGMVAAITDSELRYSKGGQMLALQMPKG